ncbi:MAG TPA: tripartite tricarboxylate transporter substrate binding protein [Pseudorhodoferax sp.]|nr:tripartite tricarboxylate transporter substrate binding protein [Pseudorhodoferax sp.]
MARSQSPLCRPRPLRRRRLLGAGVALLAGGVAAQTALPAPPQPASARPVRFLVPAPPGGPADLFARLFATHCAQAFGTPFVVENRPGAAGAIANLALARSAPDGTNFLIGSNSTFVLTPLLHRNAGYDPLRDFASVGTLTSYPSLLLGRPAAPFKDIAGLLQQAKARPGELNYASFGVGSLGHMANAYLCHAAGIRVTHVNYPGTAAVLQALAKGEADYGFDSYGNARALIEAGKLVPLAFSGAQRDRRQPQIPTLAESGFPQFDIRIWLGFVAPAGTPAEAIARLNAAMAAFTALPETQQRLDHMASDADLTSPAAMQQRLVHERSFWAGVVRDSKVVVQ